MVTAPRGCFYLFYDADESNCLLQGAAKIRPIGKATTYRKIIDVSQLLPHREDLQEEFGEIQFCGTSFGVVRMQNVINLSYSSSDNADAYSNSERGPILSRVAQVIPATLLPIQRRLTAVQDVIYFGSELGPDIIKQAVGLTRQPVDSSTVWISSP